MNCERCGLLHFGNYGSGRFCSSYCARSFSTADNRLTINEKVSLTMQGRKRPFHPEAHVWSDSDREKAKIAYKTNVQKRLLETDWSLLSPPRKRSRLLIEQNNLCDICGIGLFWNNLPLRFHYDHIYGKMAGEGRENLRMICPNCHSQTATYCRPVTEEGRNRQRAGAKQSLLKLLARVAERKTHQS